MGTEPSYAVSLDSSDQILDVLRYLATQCPARSQIQFQTLADVSRWPHMNDVERREAFERDLRRMTALCPWIKQKGRVLDAAAALSLAV